MKQWKWTAISGVLNEWWLNKTNSVAPFQFSFRPSFGCEYAKTRGVIALWEDFCWRRETRSPVGVLDPSAVFRASGDCLFFGKHYLSYLWFAVTLFICRSQFPELPPGGFCLTLWHLQESLLQSSILSPMIKIWNHQVRDHSFRHLDLIMHFSVWSDPGKGVEIIPSKDQIQHLECF